MSGREHLFSCTLEWTGNRGRGTADYRAYGRDHLIQGAGKPPLLGSSAPAFRGDADRYNPEDLLVAALASCHMLWYLHLAADSGVVVTAYSDAADGVMAIESDGGGRFTRVTLRPRVTITRDGDRDKAITAHHLAHEKCFIARSVNFPVQVEPVVDVAP
jgi:organic hydroperoxide reductase OsmC/OhrA